MNPFLHIGGIRLCKISMRKRPCTSTAKTGRNMTKRREGVAA